MPTRGGKVARICPTCGADLTEPGAVARQVMAPMVEGWHFREDGKLDFDDEEHNGDEETTISFHCVCCGLDNNYEPISFVNEDE